MMFITKKEIFFIHKAQEKHIEDLHGYTDAHVGAYL